MENIFYFFKRLPKVKDGWCPQCEKSRVLLGTWRGKLIGYIWECTACHCWCETE